MVEETLKLIIKPMVLKRTIKEIMILHGLVTLDQVALAAVVETEACQALSIRTI
jgi:hypothetical protein